MAKKTKKKRESSLRSTLVGANAPKQTVSQAVQKRQTGTTKKDAGQKLPTTVRKSVERDVSKKRDVAGTKAEAQKKVQEADRKLAKTTDRRARAAYNQEKKAAQATASALTPDEKLAKTTDRRARAAYNQEKRDLLYPVAGGDRKLSTVDKQEIQHQKALWDKGEQLKKRGRTSEGQAMQDQAHLDAEVARARRGYSGGESGADDILPKLDANEERLMTDQAKEQLRAQKRYYDIGTSLGLSEVQQGAQETADAIRLNGASWDRDRIRDYKSIRPTQEEVDAHGRPIHQYNLTRGEGEGAQAWAPYIGNQMKGAWLSLLETARTATRNMTANRYDHDYQLQKSLAEQAGRKAANERDPEERARLEEAAERQAARADALRHKDAVRPRSDGQLALQRAEQYHQTIMDAIPSTFGRYVADAAASGVQMAPAILASFIAGPAAGAALMGVQAAGGKAGELAARGVSAQEALARGAVSGVIEGVTNKIPIGSLLNMVRTAGGSKFLANVARQAGIEATEESASYVLNYAADVAARDPAASFSLADLAENAAVGAISGAAFGGLGHVAGMTASPSAVPGASSPAVEAPQETVRRRVMDAVTPQTAQEAPVSSPVPQDTRTPVQEETPAQARPAPDTASNEDTRAADFWRGVYEAQARNDPDELSALSKEADRLFDVQREAAPAASHIDNREAETLTDRRVNAFQYDNPEIKPYFRAAAQALQDDIGYSQASQGYRRGTGTIVQKSEAMRQAERQGLSRADLGRALEDIIQDDGRENNANAKRAEVVLDEMLSKGYVPNEAGGDPDARVPANEGYLRAKEQIPGAVARGSFEDYVRRNRLALETGEVTQEELRREWEQGEGGYSVGAAPSGFDPYSAALNEYGAITPGEDPARMIDVPKRTRPGTKVRRFARTFAESPGLSEEMIANFEQDVMNGLYDYTPKKLKSLEGTAVKTIEDVGFDGALEQWQQVVAGHRTATDEDIALGGILLSEAVHEGDTALVQQLSAQLAAEGTAAGRAVNALRLLKRATPEGKLYYIYRMTDKLNKDYGKKLGKAQDAAKDYEGVHVDDALAQAFLGAETDEARAAALDAIYDDIARQIPDSMGMAQKLAMQADEWRYLAMLGNPRTHIRNIIGNVAMKGLTGTRNAVSTGLQNALLDASQRTRTLSADSDAVAFAQQDFERMKDTLSGNRMDERSEIMRRVKVLPKGLQEMADLNSKALDKEDMRFKKSAYINGMAKFLTARGVDVKNGVPAELLEEARGHATEDALRATFQQYSALANSLSRFERSGPVQRLVVGSMVPFKRTPLNIAKTGVEYSPIGLARGIYDLKKKVKSGEVSASRAIDEIASGLTGTGIAALGAFLAHMGWLAGAGDDDDKQRYFDIAQGSQEYALTIGGRSYTLDWAAPSVLPLFVGVEAYRAIKDLFGDGDEDNDDIGIFTKTVTTLGRLLDPMLNMTMLSGVSGALQSAAYNQTNMLSGVAGNVATNYLGQFVPTLAGQVARTIDPVRRTTFYDKNSDVPKSIQYLLQRQGAKIPGLSQKMPEYLDVWGRQDRGSDNILLRAVENFVSPGYYSKRSTSAVDEELQRLNDAGYEGMLPSSVQKSAKVGDKRMTAEQWMTRQKEQGGTALEILQNFMGTKEYKELTDDQKAKFVQRAYEYAKNTGKAAVGGDTSGLGRWYEAANEAESEAGLSKERFLSLYAYKSALEDEIGDEAKASVKQGVWEEYINGRSDLSDKQKEYVLDKAKFWQMIPADSTAYQKAKNAGYDTPEAVQALLEAKSTFDTDGNSDVSNVELYSGIVSKTSDAAEQEKMYNALKDKDNTTSWAEFSKAQSAQAAKIKTAKSALDAAVSGEKQTSFASSVEENGSSSYVKIYRALMAVDATESERAAYYNYINSQKSKPWKKSWAAAKQQALADIAEGK